MLLGPDHCVLLGLEQAIQQTFIRNYTRGQIARVALDLLTYFAKTMQLGSLVDRDIEIEAVADARSRCGIPTLHRWCRPRFTRRGELYGGTAFPSIRTNRIWTRS